MEWTNDKWLLGLWAIPFLGGLLYYSARVSRKRTLRFLDEKMRNRLFPVRSPQRSLWRGIFLLAAFGFFFTALAGPRFGVYFENVSRKGADLVVLLDVSRSMLAEDVTPNRLESAKLDVEDLLAKISGDRAALIAFAGKPIIKVPLTTDFGFYRQVLKEIDVKSAPIGGTAIGDAVRLALRSIDPDAARDQAIILITDGDDLESMPLEAAQDAAARGVRIYAVALGDLKDGARIPLFDAKGKRTGYEQFDGKEVWSKANGELLAEMARITGGVYLPAGTGVYDLGAFYQNSMDDLKRAGYGEEEKRRLHERFQFFLFAGILSFASYFFLPAFARNPNGFDHAEEKSSHQKQRNLAMEVKETTKAKRNKLGGMASIFLSILAGLFLYGETEAVAQNSAPNEKGAIESVTTDGDSPIQAKIPDVSGKNDAKNESPKDEAKETAQWTSRDLYNAACEKMSQGENDAAVSLFKEALSREGGREIASPAEFNLGILAAGKLKQKVEENQSVEKTKEETPAPIPTTSNSPGVNPGVSEGNGLPAQPKDAVADYRQGRAERLKRVESFRKEATETGRHFQTARDGADQKRQADIATNLDVLRSWARNQIDDFRRGEIERRDSELQPVDRLRWLEEEIGQKTRDRALKSDPTVPADFQRLYDIGETIGEWTDDLAKLLSKTIFDEAEDGKNSSSSAVSPELAKARKKAMDESLAALESAKKGTSDFQSRNARDALRKATAGINAVRISYLDYPTLLRESVAFQEEAVKTAESGAKEESSRLETRDDLTWSDGFVRRWTGRLMTDAERQFAERPLTDEEKTRFTEGVAKPESELKITPEGENAAPDKSNPDEMNPDESNPDESNPDEMNPAETKKSPEAPSETPLPPETPPSPEEKIRHSMKLALELGPEIQKMTQEERDKPFDKTVTDEKEILRLLKEIAKPLQDENQDQNNQNQNNDQNQDKNKRDQKDQNQNGASDENKDVKNQEKKDLDEKKPSDQQPENSTDNQETKNDDSQEANEKKETDAKETPGDQDRKKEEEKAESLMRKVRQRQQAAEEVRKARDEYLRRTEKPEKDW